jgi:hypothetical protein
MDKKLIKEDIANMRYLLGYKAGKVISEQEQPEIDEYFYGDIEDLGKKHPERLVKHRDTGKLVGSHKKGKGFRPSPHGEELGFEHHPMDIPKGTRFGGTEIGDFDYEDDDFNFSSDEEIKENSPFKDSSGLDDYNFPDELKDRLMSIEDLLNEAMEDPENDPSDYEDMYDFASVVISDVLHKLSNEFGDKFEEYEDDVDDYLRNNEDDYIFDFYSSHSDFDDDEDNDNNWN